MTKRTASLTLPEFKSIAKKVRLSILDMIHKTKSPHIGPSFSIVEVLVALYFREMKFSLERPEDPQRDRFILSKGHACATLYAVLKEVGFLTQDDLAGFAVNNGTLEHHPTKSLKQGIEISSGSLGHGLSVGAGMAMGAKIDNQDWKTYVVLSDGELNEGSIWEAVLFASQHKLNNLVAFIDWNKIQALGFTKDILNMDPLGDKFRSFGWNVQEIDGHDFTKIFSALDSLSKEKPNLIILDTVKGKGVSFMEGELLWHYRPPDDDELEKAIQELSV